MSLCLHQVLIDTSSSMAEKCYDSVDIKKIHDVKELFDNFATRTMAYDFHHVIALVEFNTELKTHAFTETLEKFKVHGIDDALHSEMTLCSTGCLFCR